MSYRVKALDAEYAAPAYFDIPTRYIDYVSLQALVTVSTPSAKAFATSDVNATANTITEPAHGFKTGLKGQFTTTTTLPAGLDLTTDYFVIVVDANTYKVAATLALAQAGTAVDITDAGTGTHTFTPTTLAGGALKLQASNDGGTTYSDITNATVSITTTATVLLVSQLIAGYAKVRGAVYLTAGQLDVDVWVAGRELPRG